MNIDFLKQLIATASRSILKDEARIKSLLLLDAPDVYAVDGSPSKQNACELLRTLKVRQANLYHTHKLIFGLQDIVNKIEQLSKDQIILGYGFISKSYAGNIYISETNNLLIGVTIVDRFD